MYKHKETSFVITERNTIDLFLSLIERNNFELISAILDKNNNAFKDHKKLLNKLGPNLLNTLMQLALENNNSDISTLLYTSTKATHSKEQEFFNLIKERESFNNIFNTIEYLISEYNHSTKDKEKYAMKINDLVDFLLTNVENLKNNMFEGCNKNFEHDFVDTVDYISYIFPKELDNSKISELSEELHIIFKPMPDFEKKED